MAYFAPRKARTSLPCLECGKPLNIERSCLETYMACPHCNKKFPLKDFIAKADKANGRISGKCILRQNLGHSCSEIA